MQGREELRSSGTGGARELPSEAYKQSLIETARQPQNVVRNVGDVDAAFARASQMHEAEYHVPHLAHAPWSHQRPWPSTRTARLSVRAATQKS